MAQKGDKFQCKECGFIMEWNGVGFTPIIHTPDFKDDGTVNVCGELINMKYNEIHR